TFHGRPRRRDHGRSAADPARSEALATLGFERDPGAALLRRRFRELVLALHPDRNAGASVERLRAVIAAYRLLRG
ncbi:MAG: DnaJ domain, partial [Myxococcaceae bacterium]|nr:DnaJ domain [Myxococcaceae bacterium]